MHNVTVHAQRARMHTLSCSSTVCHAQTRNKDAPGFRSCFFLHAAASALQDVDSSRSMEPAPFAPAAHASCRRAHVWIPAINSNEPFTSIATLKEHLITLNAATYQCGIERRKAFDGETINDKLFDVGIVLVSALRWRVIRVAVDFVDYWDALTTIIHHIFRRT